MVEQHRAERSNGGGIWITPRQVFWAVGIVAGFSWAMVLFMNLPNFVTTKEQGQATAGDVTRLEKMYVADRTANTQVMSSLVSGVATVQAQQVEMNKKLDEAIKRNTDFMELMRGEREAGLEVHKKLRADIDLLMDVTKAKVYN